MVPLAAIDGAGLPILALMLQALAPNVQPVKLDPLFENKLPAPVVPFILEDAADVPL